MPINYYYYRNLYNKFTDGDALTDEELKSGIKFFGELKENLFRLGPVFLITAQECNRIYISLLRFQESRNEK